MARASIRDRFLAYLEKRLGGEVPLAIVFWDGRSVDFVSAPLVTISLKRPRLLRFFMLGDIGRLGEAYAKGELEVDGRLGDVIRVGVALAERVGRSPLLARLAPLAAWRGRHTKAGDRAAVAYHYDVSNDFYRLWLDRHMVYSCAYFQTGDEDLDTAQEQKLAHLCRKLRLAPGERLLDIGCGWGGLVRWAASRHGVAAVGITLSQRQAEYARGRIAAEGLSDRVEVQLQDYREIPADAPFDKIVSVGMYEHVGVANLPAYFRMIARLLKPGGLALNHGIVSTDRDGRAQGPPGGEFIDHSVFPGGEVPHVSRVLYEVAGAGLELLDLEDLRPHYPRTLLRWVKRLEDNRAAAIAAAGIERYRIWRIYMAGMAYAFDRGYLSVAQVLAQKPLADGPASRPWTRQYQYRSEPDAPLAGRLDWGDL